MHVSVNYLSFSTQGHVDVIDLTNQVENLVSSSGVQTGIITVSVIGSTAAITTIEYESGLVKDISDIMDKLIPAGSYDHDLKWGDGNGHSHLRASLFGPTQTFVIDQGQVVLGTWQQIICIDFDNRPRDRKVAVHISGE